MQKLCCDCANFKHSSIFDGKCSAPEHIKNFEPVFGEPHFVVRDCSKARSLKAHIAEKQFSGIILCGPKARHFKPIPPRISIWRRLFKKGYNTDMGHNN